MQELTDDQLDGLFRKSAEEFDVPYDPTAWQAMQDQLDDRDGSVFWRRLLRWGIPVLLLLLLTGGGWFAYQKGQSDRGPANARSVILTDKAPATPVSNVPKSVGQATNGSQPTADASIAGRVSVSPTTTLPVKIATPRQRLAKKPVLVVGNSLLREPLEKNGASRPANKPARNRIRAPKAAPARLLVKNKPTRRTGTDRTDRINSPKIALTDRPERLTGISPRADANRTIRLATPERSRPVFVDSRKNASFFAQGHAMSRSTSLTKRLAVNESIQTSATPGNVEMETTNLMAERLFLPWLHELTPLPGYWPESLGRVDREVVAPDSPEPTERPNLARLTGISLRLLVAPDLTAIGLHNFVRPGTNVGALVEYQLLPRWSIQAGVLRSTKLYEALPSAYSNTYIGTWYVKPESVSGVCDVLDVPINLRYDIVQRLRSDGWLSNRWFVSGGVSTYVMLNEKYTYNYANPNDPRIRYRQRTAKTGQYEFSHLNLSVGYERSLSRRLSWQVEPFLKTSLKGVGFYKLNLLSTGAFLSLRYKL